MNAVFRRLSLQSVRRTVGFELFTFAFAATCFTLAVSRGVGTWALWASAAFSSSAILLAAVGVWRDGRALTWWRYPHLLRAGVPLSSHPPHTELLLELEGALAAWTRLSPNLRGFLESAPDELVALAKQASTPQWLLEASALRQASEVRAHFEQLQESVFAPRAQLDTLRARSHALATAALEQRTLDSGAPS
ncbi:MAG: hypothetical protein K1X64_13385 [Myxococcaceae bacterium]|nr:hypothetical protein [Myxococcaceae bacterium]